MTSSALRSDRVVHTYGYSALLLGVFLCWYAVWTVACNILVLTGVHYAVLLWVPLAPTVVTAVAVYRYRRAIVAHYSVVEAREDPLPPGNKRLQPLGLALALAVALGTAQIAQQFHSVFAVLAGAALTSAILYWSATAIPKAPFAPPLPRFGWRLVALLVLLYATYIFGHRPDGDDANFVNLAVGAKHTAGYVYQFDTMLGDGPNLIHLPTYKFHSFELLGAVLSSYLGVEPVYVFHLILPLLLIPFLAAVLVVTFGPTAGPRWFPAALLWAAFLFLNLSSLGGWGLHGVVRLFQGKGFYVSGILPLIAVLTIRWFRRGEKVDLLALLLANMCAIGLSANGIYGGPATSALIGLPLVLTRATDATAWRRLVALAPTFAWPAVVVICVATLGLAYPSEELTVKASLAELNFVTWYGITGRIILALLLMSGLGLTRAGIGKVAAFLYVPLFLLLTMNPVGWTVILAATGNLGFRIFWSLPAPILIALVGVALLECVRVRSERAQIVAGVVAVAASLVAVSQNTIQPQKIYWHAPTLRVDGPDWATTTAVAKVISPRCRILLPERYAMLLSMKEGGAKPVAVRTLYMVHYRFTLPEPERALRTRLLLLADGGVSSSKIDAESLRRNTVALGAIAIDQHAPTLSSAATLAHELGLADRGTVGPLRLWAGACYVPKMSGKH